jgi:NAD(P)-dependent dehydrogenase (short-subunit alcohol dehydrogenase family)
MANANLVGRIGMPHDIAAMVAFLSSDDGAFVNGELINVSGGQKAGI